MVAVGESVHSKEFGERREEAVTGCQGKGDVLVQGRGYEEWTKPRAIPVDNIPDSLGDLRKAEEGVNPDSWFEVWRWPRCHSLNLTFAVCTAQCSTSSCEEQSTKEVLVLLLPGVHSQRKPSPAISHTNPTQSYRSFRCHRCSLDCAANTSYSESHQENAAYTPPILDSVV